MAIWLVTGANGFVGSQVLEALASREAGAEVVVLGRRPPRTGARHRFIEADLTEPEGLRGALRGLSPDYVIHTAGKTPPASDDELYRSNFWATTHLLAALRGLGRSIRIVLAGSAAELGPVDAADLPVAEDYPADPVGAYGRSKWMATRSGLAEGPPLEVVCARIFNPIGPGTPPTQALGAFAARLAEPGPDPLVLPVGPLDTRRDFIDVRDVARALLALAHGGRPGRVYHVGTGESHAVAEGLDRLIALSGRPVIRREDPALLRRPGPSDSRAAIGRIVAETGWRPELNFDESVRDLWEHIGRRRTANPWSGDPAASMPYRLPLTA